MKVTDVLEDLRSAKNIIDSVMSSPKLDEELNKMDNYMREQAEEALKLSRTQLIYAINMMKSGKKEK